MIAVSDHIHRTYQLIAREAGFYTVEQWLAHCQREHDKRAAVFAARYREREDLRATIAARIAAKGNTFTTVGAG